MVSITLFSIFFCQHFLFGWVVKTRFQFQPFQRSPSDFASLAVRLHVKRLVHSASTDSNLFFYFLRFNCN